MKTTFPKTEFRTIAKMFLDFTFQKCAIFELHTTLSDAQ